MEIGSRIMYMRKLKKLTQSELGDMLGVSYMTIRRWETGKIKPRIDDINKMANIFGTTAEYFMGLQEGRADAITSPTMAYWGGVLDNARKAVKDGQNLSLIYTLLMDAAGMVKSAMGTPAVVSA